MILVYFRNNEMIFLLLYKKKDNLVEN